MIEIFYSQIMSIFNFPFFRFSRFSRRDAQQSVTQRQKVKQTLAKAIPGRRRFATTTTIREATNRSHNNNNNLSANISIARETQPRSNCAADRWGSNRFAWVASSVLVNGRGSHERQPEARRRSSSNIHGGSAGKKSIVQLKVKLFEELLPDVGFGFGLPRRFAFFSCLYRADCPFSSSLLSTSGLCVFSCETRLLVCSLALARIKLPLTR